MAERTRQITSTERIGPAKLPMSLDVGRLTAREAVELFGLAVGALGAAALGMLLAWLVWPGSSWELSGWRVVFLWFGVAVGALGTALAAVVSWLASSSWIRYERRIDDYHYLYLESHEQSGGVEVERTVTGWELLSDRPLHVLGVALAVHERVSNGEATPFSVRALQGPVWLGGVRLGDLTPAGAEQASKMLADMGLIQGREARKAGTWGAETPDDVVKAVVKGWVKRDGV